MISIISGTTRKNSRSAIVAKKYKEQLEYCFPKKKTQLFLLADINLDFIHSDMLEPQSQSPSLFYFQEKYFITASHIVVIVPEYNGGIPGIFKALIDAMSVDNFERVFAWKKIALVGVSSGRSGNLRGLDYLTNLFGYVKANVLGMKLPISNIENLIDENDELTDENTISAIRAQIQAFMLL